MSRIITVTASLSFQYDLDDLDGIVDSPEGAVEDVEDYLLTGPSLNEYDISWTEETT